MLSATTKRAVDRAPWRCWCAATDTIPVAITTAKQPGGSPADRWKATQGAEAVLTAPAPSTLRMLHFIS